MLYVKDALEKTTNQSTPPWWEAWRSLAPMFVMATQGKFVFKPEHFYLVKNQGFNSVELENWKPTTKDGHRLEHAINLVTKAMNNPPVNGTEHRRLIHAQLAGDGAWEIFRHMVDAYLDGKQQALISKEGVKLGGQINAPQGKNAYVIKRKQFPNQIRRDQQQLILRELPTEAPIQVPSGPFAPFVTTADAITVYIDEAWPETSNQTERNLGVIAGVVCLGDRQIFPSLPPVKTHLYSKPLQLRRALEDLLNCTTCAPFIFSLRLSDPDEPASRHYEMLLQRAILFLLGWLLPQPTKPVKVSIYPEKMEQHNLPQGMQLTQFFKGLLAATLARNSCWNLKTVCWEDKEFGYIPYADLIGYFSQEHTDFCRVLGNWAGYKKLPGYVPFSLELVPRLERLEHLEVSANIEDVLDFAVDTGESPFGRIVLADIARRMANRDDLRQRLFETLEARYQDKVRDLHVLRRQFAAVRSLVPALPNTAPPRQRLLWHLLALQDANHDGDPQRIREMATGFSAARETVLGLDRELCAYADLHLAVHYADRFEFGNAVVTIDQWVSDRLFPALSLRQQGRMYSALGQYRAMSGDTEDAESCFELALALFDEAPLTESERAGEKDQTSIYRAINALDGNFSNAPSLVDAALGPVTEELARSYATDGSIKTQYRHHLLLRLFFYRYDAVVPARNEYLAARASWFVGHPQHPWPLISFYRGLLLWQMEPGDQAIIDEAGLWFDEAIATIRQMHSGVTMRLIAGMIAAVAACCYNSEKYIKDADELLREAEAELPAAVAVIAALREVAKNPNPEQIPDVIALLPFNYH